MNCMKARKLEGFVLIELILAMGLSLIVALALGAVMAANQTRWDNAWDKVNLQQDASSVMLTLSHSIKEATSATVENDGQAICTYDTGGTWVRFVFQPNTSSLTYQAQGQSTQTLIDGYVENMAFDVEDNKVGIDLVLQRDGREVQLSSTVQMRNYGL